MSISVFRDILKKEYNTKPPGPFQYRAILDTGASITSVSPKVIQQLQFMVSRDIVPMLTAGKPHLSNVYDVYIDFMKAFGGKVVFFDPVRVMEAPLVGQNIDCLIGRDILSRGILTYAGDTFSFSVSI